MWFFLQVRDVLKGILKPGAILDREEIQIQDNHYSLSPRQHSDHDDPKFYQDTPSELSSDTELTSPEYDPAYDFSQGQGQVDPGAAFDGHNVMYGSGSREGVGGGNSRGGGGRGVMTGRVAEAGLESLLPEEKPDI